MTIDDTLAAYTANATWSADRPDALVICCSDGRLQESVDEFLSQSLGIADYDRIYTPGGPGALSDIGCEFLRAGQYRSEFEFLLRAHSFRKLILIFHGSAADGPVDSVCAHYRRLMPTGSNEEIHGRHADDATDVLKYIHNLSPSLQIQVYRAEVTGERHVRFVDLGKAI